MQKEPKMSKFYTMNLPSRTQRGQRELSKSWVRHGYNKVARLLGKGDPKKQNFPILEGHPAAQEHAQVAVDTHESIRKKNRVLKEFKIYRWSPDHPSNKPYLQSYFIDLSNCGPMVILFIYLFSDY